MVQVVAAALELHDRDPVAARVRDPLDVDHDHRTGSRLGREAPEELVESRLAEGDHLPGAEQPDDAGRPGEGAEHDHDAAVLLEVGDRLDPAAREVQVRDPAPAENRQGPVVALRRAVDVPGRVEWRGPHEEHRLGLDEFGHPGIDHVVEGTHRFSLAPGGIPATPVGPGPS